MSVFLYNIFLWLFRAGTYTASLFHPKAKKWVRGRKDILQKIGDAVKPGPPVIWFHCASLGEFEQGRPVIERTRTDYPGYRILLTFFSPSGYEVQKAYTGADWVFYLPLDGPRTAKRFLDMVQPVLVIFVKYELWFYYLKKIKYRNIPLLLISALFRKDMSFFKWYGGLQRKMLSRFDHLFVQNESSKKLLDAIGLSHLTSVSGDTRFDRVMAIAEKKQSIPAVEDFIGSHKVMVAGSTWPEDEAVLQKVFRDPGTNLKLIIAPHETDEKHISSIETLFPGAVRFSRLSQENNQSRVLIIDNIGMLSKLYSYAYIAYVGGGLRTNGVHNVLEAAVYSIPVLFGPCYKKYTEAVGLVESGGGLVFSDEKMLRELIGTLLDNRAVHEQRSRAAGTYVQSHRGATGKIIRFIQEKRLLTN